MLNTSFIYLGPYSQQPGSTCHVCKGQRSGMCDYYLGFNTNVHYFHSLCVADQLIGIITDEQHRDEITEERMKEEDLNKYETCLAGASASECRQTNCKVHGDEYADILFDRLPVTKENVDDVWFDETSNRMNGGKINARMILIDAWKETDINTRNIARKQYRKIVEHSLAYVNNITV